jgi:high-affinity iron transporter
MPAPPDNVLKSPAAIAMGASLFAAHCAICHGAKGDGQGTRHAFMSPPPANLTVPEWSKPASAGRTFAAIRNGVSGTAMAAWPSLSDRQVWSIVAYVQTLSR